MISISIHGKEGVHRELDRIARLPAKAVKQLATEINRRVEQAADAHTDKGALLQSVYLRPLPGGWEIGHDLQRAPHAVFVHWGTRAHEIRPKNRKTLRWVPRSGGFAFARKVHHPGNAADPYMERIAADAPRMLDAIIAKRKA